jgi:hypothetical protein
MSLAMDLEATRLSTTCRILKLPMIGKELDGQTGFRLSRLFEDGPGKLVVIVDGRRHGRRDIESCRARSSLSLQVCRRVLLCVCVCVCVHEIESGCDAMLS